MALMMLDQGDNIFLKAALNHTAGQNQTLKLFKSNSTPAETDTEATYTEADFTGYSAATLTGSSWSVTSGSPTEAVYAQQTFTSSADQTSQNIYGYFVIQATSGLAMWAERFPSGPYPIANNGDNIAVTPKITLDAAA